MSATTALPPVPGLALRHLRAAGVSLGDGGTIRLDTLDRALANSDLTPAEKLQAKVGLRGRIDTTEILPAVAAIAEQIPVHPVLLRAMVERGVTEAADGKRLSASQLNWLLYDRPVGERIRLKMLCQEAAILPR
jgi:hypothetical protein